MRKKRISGRQSRDSKTYVEPFCSPLSRLLILSIQDDIDPADAGEDGEPCSGPCTGDFGAGLVDADVGTSVGLGASTSDMPTSKLVDSGL